MMKIFGPYKKRSRTASMQLSINAIVILVMAMAVLGLGLGLIRGVLGGGSAKLKDAIGSVDLSETATAEKPIANADGIRLKLGKENTVAISFYNTDGQYCPTAAKLNISCQNKDGLLLSGTDFWETENVLTVEATRGTATKLGAIYTTNTNVSTGTYPCKVQIMCGDPNADPSVPFEAVRTYSAFIEVTA